MQKKFVACVVLTLSQGVYAASLVPSAGSQIQQIPVAPTLEKVPPHMSVEHSQAPAVPASDSARLKVSALHLTGHRLYSEAQLLSLTGFVPGQELSLGQLQTMAAKIADFYHQKGYFVAQAYLPAQEIKNGAVTIAIIEGQYGAITVRNQSSLSDRLANGAVDDLHSADAIHSSALERDLLLLSDTPGVEVRSTLVPGASVGAADLIVDVTPGQQVTGSIDADNGGNRYTGQYRLGGTLNINNLAGQGDVASLRALSSFDGLDYARAAYQMQFGQATAGVAYSRLDYKLGREFSELHGNGTADIASVYGSYPLLRSRRTNLYVQMGVDYKTFDDRIDLVSSHVERNVAVLMTTLRGDHRDDFGGGGLTAGSLTWSTGNLDIETREARSADGLTARSNGHYDKLGFSAMRLQRITDAFSLYGAVNGQVASKNLDISEKMYLGGIDGVRAYPQGEAFGDEGYLATVEARYLLPPFSGMGLVQLVSFVDTGTVTLNESRWDKSDRTRTLSGAGVGINWFDFNNYSVKTYYAQKLGGETATSAPDSNGRFWVQVVKYF
ncbi:ShlB/FhaC/HecB family hemolysin secretion/activation protein [Pseudomonas congelans]|uniref:ShlB/FhaC/HecB family hemolysin secretion/activation protein n=1 Tax=Pseudomonas congelans TaxID=200452 RepID=UPI001C3425EA|nr:ShlB/FhaC/HecB family hemolysin secretion/activation protein [Pseudomonas congelans]QVX14646.1 ShlB/FhaC/HecB family hemolysin secretion/activation protein [Pseudomonas congelans]